MTKQRFGFTLPWHRRNVNQTAPMARSAHRQGTLAGGFFAA
jgi:hypothetical protein